MKHGVKVAGALVLSVAAACSSESRDVDYDNGAGPGSGSGGTGSSLDPGGEPIPVPEPETELDRAFRVPVVSGRWVWTANPISGRVALIDAKSFAIKTALAGAGPTYLAALPAPKGGSKVLVINVQSRDATLLSASEADDDVEVLATLPLHAGANSWAVNPNGRFAIAWTDASLEAKPDPSQGFQDITVLDLGRDEPTARRLSVGYRPSRIFMDDDGRYAYVVSEAGIDVLDLEAKGGAIVEREVELSASPARDTARRDVSVTPDGTRAFVRRDGKDYVTVVDLEQGGFKDIQLPGVITDLDLSADATLAIAIVREPTLAAGDAAAGVGSGGEAGQPNEGGGAGASGGDGAQSGGEGGALGGAGDGGAGPGQQPPPRSMAVLLPVASVLEAPGVYEQVLLPALFGSVELGESSETALLYSNATPSAHLTLLRLAPSEALAHRTLDLKLPVFSAASSPDGAHAIALLKPSVGSALPGAFAVVPVARNLPAKIQGTQAATVPADLATATAAMVAIGDTRALVTVTDGVATHRAYLARMPELIVDAFELASRPLPHASGLVPDANQAFIAQEHPEGRITFIDLATGDVHTLTGFELSTQVKQ